MTQAVAIHWFRRDLRLDDNTALQAALSSGLPVLPLFIFDPAILNSPRTGKPRLKFMLRALEALDAALRVYGTRLLVCHGDPLTVFRQLAQQVEIKGIYYNRDYSPYARKRDVALAEWFPAQGYADVALLPPGAVMKPDGEPYVVFSPFMRQWKQQPKADAADFVPGAFYTHEPNAGLPTLADLGADHTIDVPESSEAYARQRLETFVAKAVYAYGEARNFLAVNPFADADPRWTSALSPYLRFGLLSPRRAYQAARQAYQNAADKQQRDSVEAWVNELIWRDFYIHILYHYPHVQSRNFRPEYDALAWENDARKLQAWKDGLTGYPIVDAAMRQLRAIGWMPNRARMIVASFLTKDLLIDWREGERHFMEWLIDGDPAANNGGWQWSAGTGTDAQPYFRIFNPASQAEKFDPQGHYVRYWLPELRDVSDALIHAPRQMKDYPAPIVDHSVAREQALEMYKAAKEGVTHE